MKIITLIPDMENATSMYRGFAPMAELHKLNRTINVIDPWKVFIPNHNNELDSKKIGFSYLTAKGADLIYCVRPVTPLHMNYFNLCNVYNIPIITDWDDNLLELPHWCEVHKVMNFFDYKANIQHALRSSKHVIVSTKAIRDCFMLYTQDITVIQNAFDDYSYKLVDKRNNSKIILWRGSSTHWRDLGLYKQEILTLIFKNPDFNFCFWSDELPRWITDLEHETTNVYIKPTIHPFEYHDHLKRMQPELVIVPLEDNNFNRNKSDIAKLEAISVGSLCVSPAWNEWQWNCHDDNYTYDTETNNTSDLFFQKTQLLINRMRSNDEQLNLEYVEHLKYLKKNRLLSDANKKRLEVFRNVLA